MSDNVKLSVIIPVYNQEKYLSKCLDSVLKQDMKDIEIICVDDGSTDKSAEILRSYQKQDARIKILSQENKYAGCARNLGLAIANGEYVHFLDSDDYLFDNVYQKLYNILRLNNLEFIKFKAKIFDNETNENIVHNWTELVGTIPKKDFGRLLSFENDAKTLSNLPDTCWSGIYKKSFLLEHNISFNDFKIANDTSFFIQCIINATQVMIVDEYVVHWRANAGASLMDNRIKYYHYQFKSFKLILDLCQNIEKSKRKIILTPQVNGLMHFISQWTDILSNTKQYEVFQKDVTDFLNEVDFDFLLKKIEKYPWYETYSKYHPAPKKHFSYDIQKLFNKTRYVVTIGGAKFTISKRIKRNYKYYKKLNKRQYKKELKLWFEEHTSKPLNLKHPETINEKIQWMKLYNSTELKSKLTDKYEVREFIKEKIGEKYLIPNLGVWNKFSQINFDELPDQFVLKGTHGCGCNIIVKDKNKLDLEDAQKKFKKWLKTDYAFTNGLELHYSAIKPRIIAEKYIEAVDASAIDYKFICCDGEPELCWVTNKYEDVHKRSFYKLPNWQLQNIELLDGGAVLDTVGVPKPKKLDEMLYICKTLSKDFPLVRVDLYLIENEIYFGEMTFTSASGAANFYPDKWNYILGDKITLPSKNIVSKKTKEREKINA